MKQLLFLVVVGIVLTRNVNAETNAPSTEVVEEVATAKTLTPEEELKVLRKANRELTEKITKMEKELTRVKRNQADLQKGITEIYKRMREAQRKIIDAASLINY